MQRKLLGFIKVDFDAVTDHILRNRQILEKKWENNEAVNQHFKDFKKVYDSVMREVLYNILIEVCIPMEMVRLIKMRPNETHSRFRRGKNLSYMFPIRNGLKKGYDLSPLLYNFALEYTIRMV